MFCPPFRACPLAIPARWPSPPASSVPGREYTLAETDLDLFHHHVGTNRRTGGGAGRASDIAGDVNRHVLPFAVELAAARPPRLAWPFWAMALSRTWTCQTTGQHDNIRSFASARPRPSSVR